MARPYASVRRLKTMSVTWPTLADYRTTVPAAVREARLDRLYTLAGLLYRHLPTAWTLDQLIAVVGDYCDLRRPLYLDETTEQVDRDLADMRTLDRELSTGAADLRAWMSGTRRAVV